jgi:hypothetical protein
VIGVLAIVLASFGILGGCWAALSPWVLGAVKDLLPPDQVTGLAAMEEYRAWTVAGSLLALGLATLLMFAGIGLYQRRRWGVSASFAWALLKMAFVLGNSALAYVVQQAQFEAMGKQMPPGAPMSPAFYTVVGTLGVAFGVLWGWAFPVFLLIWLSRGKIKAEIAEWPRPQEHVSATSSFR